MRALSLTFTSGVILRSLVLGVKSVKEHFGVDTSKPRANQKIAERRQVAVDVFA